jgi:hypothetical protein
MKRNKPRQRDQPLNGSHVFRHFTKKTKTTVVFDSFGCYPCKGIGKQGPHIRTASFFLSLSYTQRPCCVTSSKRLSHIFNFYYFSRGKRNKRQHLIPMASRHDEWEEVLEWNRLLLLPPPLDDRLDNFVPWGCAAVMARDIFCCCLFFFFPRTFLLYYYYIIVRHNNIKGHLGLVIFFFSFFLVKSKTRHKKTASNLGPP